MDPLELLTYLEQPDYNTPPSSGASSGGHAATPAHHTAQDADEILSLFENWNDQHPIGRIRISREKSVIINEWGCGTEIGPIIESPYQEYDHSRFKISAASLCSGISRA